MLDDGDWFILLGKIYKVTHVTDSHIMFRLFIQSKLYPRMVSGVELCFGSRSRERVLLITNPEILQKEKMA